MTDIELLELAALAAEIEYDAEASKPHPVSKAFWGLWLVIHGEPSEYQRRNWNPLTDDGDALRLAVKLQMMIDFITVPSSWMVGCTVAVSSAGNFYEKGFTMEATRRAIVRAAAEIGKSMKGQK